LEQRERGRRGKARRKAGEVGVEVEREKSGK
jgi:hypothetical protein